MGNIGNAPVQTKEQRLEYLNGAIASKEKEFDTLEVEGKENQNEVKVAIDLLVKRKTTLEGSVKTLEATTEAATQVKQEIQEEVKERKDTVVVLQEQVKSLNDLNKDASSQLVETNKAIAEKIVS